MDFGTLVLARKLRETSKLKQVKNANLSNSVERYFAHFPPSKENVDFVSDTSDRTSWGQWDYCNHYPSFRILQFCQESTFPLVQ